MLKDWNYMTQNMDMLNLDENKFVYKKNCQLRKKCSETDRSEAMHEMGEMKRAQELRVNQVSVQRERENHETNTKAHFSVAEMQDQMNSLNDSGEFQEVESNYSGRLSHVSSQPAMIPSSRSMLSPRQTLAS